MGNLGTIEIINEVNRTWSSHQDVSYDFRTTWGKKGLRDKEQELQDKEGNKEKGKNKSKEPKAK